MRANRLGEVTTTATLLGCIIAGSAFAQGTGATVQGGANVQGGTTVQGEIPARTEAVLTIDQQIEQANATSRRATQLGERLTRMLDEARREKDIMRANCVNRKLTEVNANARNIDQRAKALRDAAAAGDTSRSGHEYTVLTVLSAKLDSLGQEATQCLGQSVYEPGASQVITTVPNDVTAIDPFSTSPTTPQPPTLINPVLGSGGM